MQFSSGTRSGAATWVFPIGGAGDRTFALEAKTAKDGQTAQAYFSVVTALYVPFNHAGGVGGQP